ncbi:MAG TPA: hypothetical protein VFN35_00065, partial [Ktedonobacteraceae bacterium]|nr:hypothetical protein [Ktedonobacteraceae bacterium]
MVTQARIKQRTYFDSITLMKVARALTEMAGIEDAAALMGTPANLQLLTETGLAPFEGADSEPMSEDMLIVVRASDKAHAEAALTAAEEQLLGIGNKQAGSATGVTEGKPPHTPRSLEEASATRPDARIALISVPGMYATLEAEQALRAGLHVFLFSDNVSRADEAALKQLAEERDLLMMGPDCGTARLNGVGLGFVNVVPDGPVGIVGASGTGMQQVMCLLAETGHGVSQAIGCGSRDLSAQVGGVTTLRGLKMLQEDAQTQVIVLISKPPAREVAEAVLTAARRGKKPVVVCFIGEKRDAWQGEDFSALYFARTLDEAARMAGELCSTGHTNAKTEDRPVPPTQAAGQPPYLAALFSGGTLCAEALSIWGEQIGPIYSNLAFKPEWSLSQGQSRTGHYALDLGADEYTLGRPHPMIDPGARLKHFSRAASDPQVGVILLDIVLGYCAHPDPA